MPDTDDQIQTLGRFLKQNVLWVAGLPVLGVIVSVGSFDRISSISTSATVGWLGALGFQLTAWGLLVSIVGFGFTLWQLQKTQGASAAAAQALARIKRDYNSFDLVTEIRTARAYAEATQSHISDGRWAEALANYNNLRASLNKISAVKNGLSTENLEEAKNYLASALDACLSIDRLKIAAPEQIPADTLNGQLRELDGFLITQEYSLKDAIRGPE